MRRARAATERRQRGRHRKIFEELGRAPLKDAFLLITFATALVLCMILRFRRKESLAWQDALFGLLIAC